MTQLGSINYNGKSAEGYFLNSLIKELKKKERERKEKKEKKKELKKEFIGPELHLRPVHADHAQPPLQWTLNSVSGANGNDNRRLRTPSGQGTLEDVSRLLLA